MPKGVGYGGSRTGKKGNSKKTGGGPKQSVFGGASNKRKPATRPAPSDSGGSGGSSLNDQ